MTRRRWQQIKEGWHSCRPETRLARYAADHISPWLLAFVFVFAASALADDFVHLHDGRVLQGKITRVATISVSMKVRLPGVAGTADREIDMKTVNFIDFEPLPGEEEALAKPDATESAARFKEIWASRSNLLPFSESNAGRIGLHVAADLLASDDPVYQERALAICRMIEKDDWDEARRAEAQKGKLRTLIALKRVDEAMAEARHLAQTTEDPSLVLEARLVLAAANFERLKTFEKDHPRWMDVDDLTSERTALYHQVLDEFLYAPLFHGAAEDKAAEALWQVVQVHRFAKEADAARDHASDLIALYPSMPQAEHAKAFLAESPDTP